MPKPRTPILLFVLFAPLTLLAILAVRTFNAEREAMIARAAAEQSERLSAAASILSNTFSPIGAEETAQVREVLVTQGEEALRYLVLTNSVAYALVFDESRRVFPPNDTDMLLTQKLGGLRVFQDPALNLIRSLSTGVRSATSVVASGSGDDAMLRCSRDGDAMSVCVVVEPEAFRLHLRSAVGLAARSTGLQRLWLVSSDNRRIGDGGSGVAATSFQPLDGMFQGWRIETAEVRGSDSALSRTLALFVLGGSVIAAWGALTWGFHRSFAAEAESTSRRSAVIALLSHELRTPLANLQLYVDLMRRKAGDAQSVTEYCGILESEIGRLSHLAENAIDIGRGGVTQPQLESGNPDEVLKAILRNYAPILERSNCAMALDCGAAGPVAFDKSSWQRVAVNLLDNARKYAPGSNIDVATRIKGGYLKLEIRDHGAGVEPGEEQAIFEPLKRGGGTSAPGFGLGLASVRSLARQNGGDAWVENARPGARFCVTMKAEPAPC